MPSKTKAISYTVEVVDNAGKAIHTSKTIFSALKEAREAYKAKRAEKQAQRQAEKAARFAIKQRAYEEQVRQERRVRREARRLSEDDERAEDRRRERQERRERRLLTDGSETSSIYSSPNNNNSQSTLMSTNDLALPPPILEEEFQDDHLTALLYQVTDIIDHVGAVQTSVFTLIDALRRDPETLAMVGLTLAEISTVLAKLSPGIVAGLKVSWPVVFTFLASPQFAILAGVGIGTTIVLIGGFKIIKKMIMGEPAKPPEIIDMGGRVVEEAEMRTITQAVEEVRVTETSRERERERPQRRAIEEDPLAFGHKDDRPLRRRHTDREIEGPKGSFEEIVRPTAKRSYTTGAESKRSEPIAAKSQRSDVPPLAFDVPKSSKDKTKSRSHESRSRSSRSDSASVVTDGKRPSGKREREMVKELEEGGKYLVVRRRK